VAYRYFDFYGKPARVTVDDEDIPELCEVYDPEQRALVRRNDLELDVIDSYGSNPITREKFEALLAKVRSKGGK